LPRYKSVSHWGLESLRGGEKEAKKPLGANHSKDCLELEHLIRFVFAAKSGMQSAPKKTRRLRGGEYVSVEGHAGIVTRETTDFPWKNAPWFGQ